MDMGQARKVPKNKLLDTFSSLYEEHHGEPFLVNWPMIKTAEKLSAYYTFDDLYKALSFYFRTRSRHNIWDFFEQVDSLLAKAVKEEEAQKRIRRLMEETERRMEEFS